MIDPRNLQKTDNVEYIVSKSVVIDKFKPKHWFRMRVDKKHSFISASELPNGDLIIKAHHNKKCMYIYDKDYERFEEILETRDYPLLEENLTPYFIWKNSIDNLKNGLIKEDYFIDYFLKSIDINDNLECLRETDINLINKRFNDLDLTKKKENLVPLQLFLIKNIRNKLKSKDIKPLFHEREFYHPFYEINYIGERYIIEDFLEANSYDLNLKKLIILILRNYVIKNQYDFDQLDVDRKIISRLKNNFDEEWCDLSL